MFRLSLLLFFTMYVPAVLAQKPSVRFSLPEALERFTASNLQLIAERCQIGIAQAQVVQAKLLDNPDICLEQNIYNRNNGTYFDMGRNGEAAIEIEQLIYIAGQRNHKIRVEKMNKEMSVYQFEELLRTLRYELKSKFVDLYYTRKSLAVYDCEISHLKDLLKIYQAQHDKGNISLLEKSRIQAFLLSLKMERNGLVEGIIALSRDLNLLLNLPDQAMFEPAFDESVPDKIHMDDISLSGLASYLAERPDMKLADFRVRSAEANISLQKALAFPEVRIKGIYDRAGNFCNNYFAIGLNLSIPVFNRNQGNIKAARLSMLQNENLKQYTEKSLFNELLESYSKLNNALELYRDSNNDLERDFTRIIAGVNESFGKRNISLLEFIDYYQAYKESCLQRYDTAKNVVLAAEEMNLTVGTDLVTY